MYENLTYMAQVQLSCTSSLTVIASTANTDTMVSSVFADAGALVCTNADIAP